jgi:hypothetical protein
MGAATMMKELSEIPTDPNVCANLVVQRALDTSQLEELLQKLIKGLLAERLSFRSVACST